MNARKKQHVPPLGPGFDPKAPDDINLARLKWRKSLSEEQLRGLAADYIRGDREQCAVDAFAEYEVRFGKHSKSVGPKKAKKRSKGRTTQ